MKATAKASAFNFEMDRLGSTEVLTPRRRWATRREDESFAQPWQVPGAGYPSIGGERRAGR